jgi:ArsR family transcriptional regulator
MKSALTTTAVVTKALAHRGRLRILALLSQGETSVCQMAAAMKIPVSTMSGLLLELRQGGLVREERRGKWVFYSILDEAPARAVLDAVLAQVQKDPQVRRDAAAAAKLRARSPAIACTAAGVTHGPRE